MASSTPRLSPLEEAAMEFARAADAKKCWPCGCFQDAIEAVERGLARDAQPPMLEAALARGKQRSTTREYDCLGCRVCYPANALNALAATGAGVEVDPCPTLPPEQRDGWPPLPGDFSVVRYLAPVAVCVLHSAHLIDALARGGDSGISIAGTLHTENLGIERLITNVLANPNIRFLILCGEDSMQAIGHLPGQSLVSLARQGLDERGRIVGAKGKRPVIKNVSREVVERFVGTVEVVDLIGQTETSAILASVAACKDRDPGPADPFGGFPIVPRTQGRLPERMIPDPAGYFVIYADRARDVLLLEHYGRDGVLDRVLEGRSAAELYTPAIEDRLVSRLDHAAYLGRELARAETALAAGSSYIQDGTPEWKPHSTAPESCGCHPAGKEEGS